MKELLFVYDDKITKLYLSYKSLLKTLISQSQKCINQCLQNHNKLLHIVKI